jgi:hypothetical protein
MFFAELRLNFEGWFIKVATLLQKSAAVRSISLDGGHRPTDFLVGLLLI